MAQSALTSSSLVLKTARELFSQDSEREEFIAALSSNQTLLPAVIWTRDPRPADFHFQPQAIHSLAPEFVQVYSRDVRLGAQEWHAEGYYYCLDFSSVFTASVMLGVGRGNGEFKVLDLCSAPGGKAIFAWKLFSPSKLLCNEVIGKRHGMLISNLRRCRVPNSEVWHCDSSVLAREYPEEFDLVIVDAPCSGQSLLAKGEAHTGAFHPALVNKCANRQRRIISNAAKLVKRGGFLAYMTCTFALRENEEVLAWFLKHNQEYSSCELVFLREFASSFSEFPCYRLFPQQGLGLGGFSCLLRRG